MHFCLFIYPLTGIWVVSTFCILNNAAVNIGVKIFIPVSAFNSFGYIKLIDKLRHVGI